jgi:hypothetical protein
MPTLRSLLSVVLLVTPALGAAQQTRPRTIAAEIDGHRRFLSSDLLERRAARVATQP